MLTTDKYTCRELTDLMVAQGICHAVLCPGSRNAPLIVAMNRHPEIRCYSIIDERSAAFFALGLSSQLQLPVALVCTSGSAILNFAPAIAEAYYRHVPLIVISADRPLEWIDQDDSQTIRQNGVLDNIVKQSWMVPTENGDTQQAWYINRILNDALLSAKAYPQGPVHINMHLDIPLGNIVEVPSHNIRIINSITPESKLENKQVKEMARVISTTKRVLVIAGFMAPDQQVSKAMARLAAMPNVGVMCEAQANVHAGEAPIYNIDSVLSVLTSWEREIMAPDIVITVGGALVSRFVKDWLRREGNRRNAIGTEPLRHWHVGSDNYSVDCFQCLELRIEMPASEWLHQVTSFRPVQNQGNYNMRWQDLKKRAYDSSEVFAESCPWSDFMAMKFAISHIPPSFNLQLSNGTAIRYAQLFDYNNIHRIDCNRGVSGIDGCTSTAIGASVGYNQPTILISGDMSAQYDVGALAIRNVSPLFKIVVLNNQGGGIFRFVSQTAKLDECEQYFCCNPKLPLRALAHGYGFAYFEATNMQELVQEWQNFLGERELPAIINILTPAEDSADILRLYFDRTKNTL